MAGGHEFADLLRQRGTDTLERLEFAAVDEILKLCGIEASDDTCAAGIGSRFKGTFALEFQQGADLFKDMDNGLFIHETNQTVTHQDTTRPVRGTLIAQALQGARQSSSAKGARRRRTGVVVSARHS